MKKFLVLITALLSLSVFMLVGCGGKSALIFEKKWVDTESSADGYYREFCEYDVSYSADYSDGDYSYVKAEKLNGKIDLAANGTYTTEVRVVKKSVAIELLTEKGATSDILDNEAYTEFLVQETKLDLTVKYDTADGTTERVDKIYTTAISCKTETSLAPIFSASAFNYLVPMQSGNSAKLIEVKGNSKVTYNTNNYTVTKEAETGGKKSESTTTYNYSFRTAIDNASLLFGLRNTSIAQDKTADLCVVSISYGVDKSIRAKCFSAQQIARTLTVNGSEKPSTNIDVSCLAFNLNDSYNTGKPQLSYVQNKENETVGGNKALLVRYVEPLFEYSEYLSLGSLCYNLSSLDYGYIK